MSFSMTEQTKLYGLTSPNSPKYGYKQSRNVANSQKKTDQIMAISQTKQTEIWVFTRQNRPKNGY